MQYKRELETKEFEYADRDVSEKLSQKVFTKRPWLFRPPAFYLAFRTKVIPLLRTYPFVRLWVAGCSTGEEVYSLAILLEEEGLYDRCRIYATDAREAILEHAKAGSYPKTVIERATEDYRAAGGQRRFAEFVLPARKKITLDPALKRHILFAQHNLATDASFNDFHVVSSRNVGVRPDKWLQARVHHLFYESLIRFGAFCVGSQRFFKASPHREDFEALDAKQNIYRRIK